MLLDGLTQALSVGWSALATLVSLLYIVATQNLPVSVSLGTASAVTIYFYVRFGIGISYYYDRAIYPTAHTTYRCTRDCWFTLTINAFLLVENYRCGYRAFEYGPYHLGVGDKFVEDLCETLTKRFDPLKSHLAPDYITNACVLINTLAILELMHRDGLSYFRKSMINNLQSSTSSAFMYLETVYHQGLFARMFLPALNFVLLKEMRDAFIDARESVSRLLFYFRYRVREPLNPANYGQKARILDAKSVEKALEFEIVTVGGERFRRVAKKFGEELIIKKTVDHISASFADSTELVMMLCAGEEYVKAIYEIASRLHEYVVRQFDYIDRSRGDKVRVVCIWLKKKHDQ